MSPRESGTLKRDPAPPHGFDPPPRVARVHDVIEALHNDATPPKQ